MEHKYLVDARGDQCPIPVVKAKKAMETAEGGAQITVLVDNGIAVLNLTRIGNNAGAGVHSQKTGEQEYRVEIQVPEMSGMPGADGDGKNLADLSGAGTAGELNGAAGMPNVGIPAAGVSNGTVPAAGVQAAEALSCIPDQRGDLVIAVDTAVMGRGNDELGRVLMKGFLFAVTQLPVLPKTMLFYNGGVLLTTEGSDSLEDLRSLEAQGVTIKSCGTCLNYYNLTDKLAVGEVTNMYDIAETLSGAAKVIKP